MGCDSFFDLIAVPFCHSVCLLLRAVSFVLLFGVGSLWLADLLLLAFTFSKSMKGGGREGGRKEGRERGRERGRKEGRRATSCGLWFVL